MIAALLTLALGPVAEARGHLGARHLGLRRNPAALGVIRAPERGRNIRSGDHVGWHQGDHRT